MEIMFQEDMERYKNNKSLIYHTYEDFKAKIQEKQLTSQKTTAIIKSSERYNNKNIKKEDKKMTKRELIEMVRKFDDNDEILFVVRELDRDGYPEDVTQDVYKIVKKGTPKKRQMYID